MNMKALGIIGSARKNGNTAALVKTALEAMGAEGINTEVIMLDEYDISGCRGCEGCRDTCRCVLRDGMQKIYPLLLEADAVVLGSPTHFYNISSAVSRFFERCYCFEAFDEDDRSIWASVNEALGGKYAAVIAVCEQADEADMGFTAEAMRLPLESLGYRVVDTVKALKLFEKGAALRDDNALAAAAAAGKKLARTMLLKERLADMLR